MKEQAIPASQAILVVDDSIDTHQNLRAELAMEPYAIHHAFDARSGLLKAHELRPDLVLLDLGLAGMGGLELCRELKANAATRDLPVMLLAGPASPNVMVEAFDLDVCDYVRKPLAMPEAAARIRAALRAKQRQDQLAARAQIDELTGLPNRAHFDARLRAEVAASVRHGRPVAVAVVGIDDFRRINDNYGHLFGDSVLEKIGETIGSTVRASDVACRYAGDEFAIALREADIVAARGAAARLRRAIAELPIRHLRRTTSVTASIGLCAVDLFESPRDITPEGLVEAARAALLQAKVSGRNRIEEAERPVLLPPDELPTFVRATVR